MHPMPSYWLLERNHIKWGFVIYRRTYADDEAWARFISVLKDCSHNYLITQDGARELAEKLVWTVHEDRASLDGASVEQVREHYPVDEEYQEDPDDPTVDEGPAS